MTLSRKIAPALALAALITSQTAQAQQPTCVAAADLSDAAAYALPIAFDATQTACANRLPRDGFVATKGEAFIAKFRAGQDKAWPGAFRLIKTFMADDASEAERPGDEFKSMIAALPDEALRPFVDGIVGQLIAGEIKGDSCTKIERGLELISPLPTENVGGLVAFIAELSDLKNPAICASAPAVMAK
ncbi:MAG: hypothetical protein NWP98_10315 [Erythrobacter sp.]|nr:hypothetical protein [Erythrobacter sp.]